MNPNLLRLRLRQLALQVHYLPLRLRVFLHHADVALYNLRVLRLKRKCERMNLTESVNIPPVFRPAFNVFGNSNDVSNDAHVANGVVMPNGPDQGRRASGSKTL